MKIKISTIEKTSIVFFLLMQLSYFKLFGNVLNWFAYSFNPKPLQIFYFVMVLTLALLGIRHLKHTSRVFWLEIVCCIFPTTVNIFIEVNNGADLSDLMGFILPFWYVLLAVPVLRLLQSGQWEFDKMIKTLIILIIGSLCIRMVIVFYYSISGITLFPNIAMEGAVENWVRNGRLRVNPSSLSILLIPLSYYWILQHPKKRLLGIVGIIVGLLYPGYATQARSMMLYGIVTVGAMYLFQNVSEKMKLFRYFAIIIIFVIVVNTKQFNTFFDSFSATNAETGLSTSVRLAAIAYYGGMFLKNPMWGNGFTRTVYSGNMVIGHITDIGIIGVLFQVGILIGVFYLVLIIGGLAQIHKKQNDNNIQLLIFGCSVAILLSEINIDCFIGLFALSIPFIIAITEYYREEN